MQQNTYLKSFRKQFKIDQKANLENISLAVETVIEAQRIGFDYLSVIDPIDTSMGFRIHGLLNLMSRVYEQAQAMLVALATGSPTAAEALSRIVVEGSVNLIYMAKIGDASTLLNFLESWIEDHDKKLNAWNSQIQNNPHFATIREMIKSRQHLLDIYREYLVGLRSVCSIDTSNAKTNWPSNILRRFVSIDKEIDYYTIYHRLSGASHITGEDTLSYLFSTDFEGWQQKQVALEAWAYSTMMTRIATLYFIDAVTSCVVSYGREKNEDLEKMKTKVVQSVHEIHKSAGVPTV